MVRISDKKGYNRDNSEIIFLITPELQIRGPIEDNSKIIFLISQCKHIL